MIFRSISNTELEKRRHIAIADGRKLQELTRKTEILLAETEALAGRRLQLSAELLGQSDDPNREVSLAEIVDAALAAGLEQAEHLRNVASTYRLQIAELSGNLVENQRLLTLAGQSFQRLLHGVQSAAGRTDTYGPRSEEGRRKAQSVILNANA